MKKRKLLVVLAAMTALNISACGAEELTLVTDHVEIELGSELDTTVTNYVNLEDAVVDFSAVDTLTAGTYNVPVTYEDMTATFEVSVVDTTAPTIECVDTVTVEADTVLSAEEVITNVIELSGAVEVTFAEPEAVVEEVAEETEAVENTEMVEATEVVGGEETETVESTEVTEEVTEQETELVLEPFTVGDVLCANDYIIIDETGEYDALLTVADASGNTAEALIHIVVGEAPTISGVEDITVTVGTEEVDYLDGVTATDCEGNDITDKITVVSSIVDLETVGEYGIVYNVVDENGFEANATALVTVKEKASRTSSTASSNSSKPNSTNASGTASSANATTSNTSTSNQSTTQNASSNTNNTDTSASSTTNQSTTQTPSADTTTTSTPSADTTTTQTPSADTTTTQTPSADTTTTTTPSTDTSTGGMAVPDNINIGSMEDYDNTGTGGEAGGDWAVGGGNF